MKTTKMKSMQTQLKNFGRITFLVIFFSLFLQGCMQAAATKKSTVKNASTDNSTTKVPTFASGTNFIQNGVSVYLSTVALDMTFADSLQLRGKDVDAYIRATGTSNVVCLTSRFTQQTVMKVIILAAIPRSVYNFSTQTLEYYYNLTPADSTSNQSFCQKTGLINNLYAYYPTLTPKYKMADICPTGTCSSSNYASQALELYNTSGIGITTIATKQLLFSVTNNPTATTPTGLSCTDSSTCTAQGYDCCSSGQCVKDLAVKPGVDTASADYLQALQDILNNPSNIYSYPQYYFICSSPVTTPTSPVEETDPVNEAGVRLKNLENLYNCTSKIEGEYGLCTKTYKNAVAGVDYSAGKDDRNFSDTFTHLTVDKQTLVSVEKILYGEVVIFDYALKTEGELYREPFEDLISPAVRITGGHNDDLSSGATVRLLTPPAAAVSKDLVIKYKIDASCIQINSSLAKCEKYYIQGQENSGSTQASKRQGRVTDHFPTSNIFKLPYYADTSKAITVDVDGLAQKQDIDWQMVVGAQSTVQFLPLNTLKVFTGQKVRITYFVNMVTNPNVMASKLEALNEIKTICSCAGTNCSLTPVKNSADKVVDYACVYPDPAPVDPPVSQKVYVSSKAVPVRFFDSNGTSQTTVNANTLPQEGKAFKYRSDNLLNPSNVTDITNLASTEDTYTGFNEIYGSLSYTSGSAKPAYEVAVKKGNSYDIYVDRGSFSNCIQCGNDYYSQLTKLFPLTQFGGGSAPLLGQTNRSMSSGIRSDEMKFGRACVVPATMIPWTHGTESSAQTQRLNRMRAQHFMYANGYQYDWYGFDYGSVIGSFDGVKWFSIGTNRRIKAETSKMFVAINGAMGDLTLEATYEVTVNDATLNPLGTNMVTSDFQSDGAQCQQFHQCSTDNDCATTLGWEYACAPVGEATTSWPKFDDNGKEIPETVRDDNRLTSILGVSNTGKRCVYRGRGALCTPNYGSVNINSTFNQSTSASMHACSDNSYCQTISTNGTAAAKFNNRIVRFGKVRTDTTVDTFGLAALIPGRPFAWNAVETPRAETLKNLNTNRALAMCIPGRDVEASTFQAQNNQAPAVNGDYTGDKVLGMGMSLKLNNPAAQPHYLDSCSIMDSSKTFYHNSAASPAATINSTNYPLLKFDAGSQAVSTNALNIFNSIFNSKGITFGLLKTNSSLLTAAAYTENRCMRAPAASCFTDMDCSPSKVISDKLKSISAEDTTVQAILNKYEIKFWQEELICSQAIDKTSLSYDPKNNHCCRDIGNAISLPSADSSNLLNMKLVPGIDYQISNKNRYTRSATMYKETNTDPTTFPELRVAVANQCTATPGTPNIPGNPVTTTCGDTATLANQWRTFAGFAEKTSCSGDWIRSFSTGTHKWEVARFQTFTPTTFQCMNWYPGTGGYTCEAYEPDDPNCPLAQTPPTTSKGKEVLSYLARLELMGIPQVALESNEYYSGPSENGLSCKSYPNNRATTYPNHPTSPGTNYSTPTQMFALGALAEYMDASGTTFYSAADTTNFKTYKQVFKADEVVSCLPAGTQMKTGDDAAKCCTGMINATTLKCQLGDYIDVSIYTNRYVSSEAKKLSTTLFDQYGYLKDPAYAAQLACEKSMCASGTLAYGVLISRLKTPGQTDSDSKYYRFLEGNSADNLNGILDLYNKGLKLNNHVYCVPQALASSSTASDDLTIISCGN